MEKFENIIEKLNNRELSHDAIDCFFQLIEGVDAESLDNLLDMMVEYYDYVLTKEKCYEMLQNKHFSKEAKEDIFKLANECIDKYRYLGTKLNEYGINTSSWISHSIQEARLCSHMATCIQADPNVAYKMGLLHDYGRKYNHGGAHIILGFEKLYELGYIEESIGCLTHSFLNGNFFACYAPSDKYVVNENLEAIPVSPKVIENGLCDFLSKYEYTAYDLILTLSDLMATDHGIVSPSERIADIETRRKMEGLQREFFLNQLAISIKLFLECMGVKNIDTDDYETLSNMLCDKLCVFSSSSKQLSLTPKEN